jgi:hypothetical protein
MEKDPKILTAAEACRELQECRKLYNRAEYLVKLKPTRAKEFFAQIVDRAPADSEVCRAAREQIEELTRLRSQPVF